MHLAASLGRGNRRSLWLALAVSVLVASIIAVPGATPAKSKASPDITFVFQFADGAGVDAAFDPTRTIDGTATSNDVDVSVPVGGRDCRHADQDELRRLVRFVSV